MSEDNHKIEDIKHKLYEREDTVTHRNREGILHPIGHKVEVEWKKKDETESSLNKMRKPKTSVFKKFFIISIIFFFIAIGFALYMFYTGSSSVSSDNIDITVMGNAFTKGGEELPLQIEIVNHNKASLELSNLMVSYPSGASDSASDYTRLPRMNIGTIKPGETVTKNIKVILFGDEKSNRSIKIDLDYHPEGSNAIFTKSKEYIVNISSSPLSLTIEAPDTVSSNQPVSFKIMATLNTKLPDNNIMMQITYPNNFIFESAVPAPSFGNSVWSLEGLDLSNPIPIVVTGRIVGQDQDQQVFHVYAGTVKPSDKSTINVVYNSLLHTVTVVKPIIEANILVDDTASPNSPVNVKIDWANNLSSRITDGQIIANLSGNAYDKSLVTSNEGFFDSLNNRIIWDKNSTPSLSDIEPGGKGEVSFSLKSIPLLGAQSSIKNPQLGLDVSIKGRQPTLGSTYTEVNNFSKKIVKIESNFQIASSALYKSGPFPPKAESETQYSVTWTLSNGTNAISGAVARSVLPGYVKWIGSSSHTENIQFNQVTNEVIWNIGSARANIGGGSNREVSFTIALNPSLSQVGSVPQLMKEIFLSGTDVFTGTLVKDKRQSINTDISDDPNFQTGFDRVVQ